MLVTDKMIEYLPAKLKAFKRYIEKYDCIYMFSKVTAIIFYHKETGMPYVMLAQAPESSFVEIYVNYQADDWGSPECPLRKENLISNDMNSFLLAIRECKESNNG